jgi:hypothetical protein
MSRSKQAKESRWPGYAAIFVAGIAVGAFCLHVLTPTPAPAVSKTESAALAAKKRSQPTKPWGILETSRILLAKDDQLFPDRDQRLRPPAWFFDSMSPGEVAEFFASCNLGGSEEHELTRPGCLQAISNGCLVLPPAGLVQDLLPSTRSKIYSVLARSPLNYAQRFPFRFAPDSFASRFEGTDLSKQKIELLWRLTYTNASDLCLADIELLPGLLSTNEFEDVVDSLYRVPAYRVRLHIFPDSDIESLISYWGKGSRPARIRPLLQSLAKTPGDEGGSVNIGYFLPPFARLRLYTFPDAWNEAQASKEDCFWTSMNFFKDKPDMRYLDPVEVRKALQNDFALLHEQPAFGDLVTLINSSGDAIHMCVYIADDVALSLGSRAPHGYFSLEGSSRKH